MSIVYLFYSLHYNKLALIIMVLSLLWYLSGERGILVNYDTFLYFNILGRLTSSLEWCRTWEHMNEPTKSTQLFSELNRRAYVRYVRVSDPPNNLEVCRIVFIQIHEVVSAWFPQWDISPCPRSPGQWHRIGATCPWLAHKKLFVCYHKLVTNIDIYTFMIIIAV